MRVRTGHVGRQMPFERERRLVLHRLPVGAVVSHAVLTFTPVSTDDGGQFLESITFSGGQGDWGATKVTTSSSVEVALHARRRLASLTGRNLAGVPLLADLGGGFLPVNDQGAFGDGPPLTLTNAAELPGLLVTGLRAPGPGGSAPDVTQLRVSSPPSNLTVAVEGGPVFFAHLGDLMSTVTTPDFGSVLGAMLPGLPVENGCHVVPFVVHSDTIARLDVRLDVEYALATSAAPDGVRSVQASYAFGGAPVGGQGALAVSVPPGMVAVASTGRAQGAFAETRVVLGPVTTSVPPELVTVAAGQSLAQQVVPPETVVASSVDLLLTAVTAEAALVVDVVDDLDGKPGRTSLLPRPADLRLTRDTAGAPTWVNVPLPSERELAGGVARWVVVQARSGSAAWSAGADDGSGGAAGTPAPAAVAPAGTVAPVGAAGAAARPAPGLQTTRDGGLSWRAAAGTATPAPLRAPLRLRHTLSGYRMPLELRVDAGGQEVAVDLQRFAASGTVDVALDAPEVAQAVNAALAAAGAGGPAGGGERVANGDLVDWYRVGTALARVRSLHLPEGAGLSFGAAAFGPGSDAVHTVAGGQRGEGPVEAWYVRYDVLSSAPLQHGRVGAGMPVGLALDATGGTAVLGLDQPTFGVAAGPVGGQVVLVDTEAARPVGGEIATPELVADVVADGLGVYVVGLAFADADGRPLSRVRHATWSQLRDAAAGAAVPWGTSPLATVNGRPRHAAVGRDGRLVLVVREESPDGSVPSGEHVVTFAGRAAVDADDDVSVPVPDAVQAAVAPDGTVLVLTRDAVQYRRPTDLGLLRELPFPSQDGAAGYALAVAPQGDVAVVVRQESVELLDVPNRRWLPSPRFSLQVAEGGGRVVVSPAGTHAVHTGEWLTDADVLAIGDALPAEWEVTAGRVRPVSLPATGEVLALLGDERGAGDRAGKGATSGPASMAQVVPVVAGARYRFSFDGLSLADGGVAQVRWSGDRCAPGRVDRVPVTAFDPDRDRSLAVVPHHEALLVAPAAAVQAEVRFYVPDTAMVVDKVSLLASADVTTSTWTPADPGTTVVPGADDVTLSNTGVVPSEVAQVVAVRAGDEYALEVVAVPSGEPGSAVELAFADDTGAPVGELVRVGLDPLDLDAHAAAGTVPTGATEAQLRVVLPPGGVVVLRSLSLSVGQRLDVTLVFASETPGDLRLSDVGVTLDHGTPTPVPVPDGGLCPVTPTGDGPDGESCHCQRCGRDGPVRQPRPAVTPAGRPVVVTACPTCGTDRVRLGGRVALRAQPVELKQFRVENRPQTLTRATAGPAVVSRVELREPLEAVDGVAAARAQALKRAGFPDVVALSRADVADVAALPGVSAAAAARIVEHARTLVRERGQRVVFD